MISAGFQPANLDSRGEYFTPRLPGPTNNNNNNINNNNKKKNKKKKQQKNKHRCKVRSNDYRHLMQDHNFDFRVQKIPGLTLFSGIILKIHDKMRPWFSYDVICPSK